MCVSGSEVIAYRCICRGMACHALLRKGGSMAESRIKAQIVGEGRIGGYLVLWGTPQARDLHGEYFTPETDLGLDWYDQRPVLYQHGLDGQLKAAVIGQ